MNVLHLIITRYFTYFALFTAVTLICTEEKMLNRFISFDAIYLSLEAIIFTKNAQKDERKHYLIVKNTDSVSSYLFILSQVLEMYTVALHNYMTNLINRAEIESIRSL